MRHSAFMIICVALFIGCTNKEAPKTSHFEHDHHVADHWPDGLADAANKIRERLDQYKNHPAEAVLIADEITDIVGWVPEIAADTDLSEQDWIPT